MNREEAEQYANKLLSHYGKQSWDEHFKAEMTIDNPSRHILVKSIDEFAVMLQRRGYRLEEHKDKDGTLYKVKVGRDWQITEHSFRAGAFLYKTVDDVASDLDKYFAQGWKHMQCAQCGTPLLCSFKYVDEEEKALKWYGVCSVQAGPYTEHLEVCPGCGVEFGYPPPVKEINDVN